MSRWRTWGEIPTFMKNDFTLKYYRHLSRKRTSMVFKRIFDVIMSAVLLVLLSPVILVLAVWIKVDSRGPVFQTGAHHPVWQKVSHIQVQNYGE